MAGSHKFIWLIAQGEKEGCRCESRDWKLPEIITISSTLLNITKIQLSQFTVDWRLWSMVLSIMGVLLGIFSSITTPLDNIFILRVDSNGLIIQSALKMFRSCSRDRQIGPFQISNDCNYE